MLKVLIYCLLMSSFCTAAMAQDLSNKKPVKQQAPEAITLEDNKIVNALIFNLGAHTEFYNNVQTDDSGSMRKIDFAPVIGAGLVIPFYQFHFLPELNWVLPQEAGSSKIIKNLFMIRADLGYDPLEWLRLRLGTSVMWGNQHGTGGKTQIKNGNSTSTFYYPDENRSSLNNTLDLGAEVLLGDWSLRLQTYTYSLFKEERRQLSYTIFVSYYWDQ